MTFMSRLRLARRTLLVSCVLFFVVLASPFLAIVLNAGDAGGIAVLVLFWLALLWQVFTVYHCGRFFVVRLLLYIYGIVALGLTIAVIY